MQKLFLTLLLTVFSCSALYAQPGDETIHVMTYNIRYDDKEDNPESWSNRKEGVISLLQYHQPDLFGTQERLQHQLEYIKNNLEGRKRFGEGRRGGSEGEYSAIFYHTDRFELRLHQRDFSTAKEILEK